MARRCRRSPARRSHRPAGFFANLTKRFFRSHEEVELSALENAIAVAVDTVEMLRQSKVATLVRVLTSVTEVQDSRTQRSLPKARMTIVIRRTDEYVNLLHRLAEEQRRFAEMVSSGTAPKTFIQQIQEEAARQAEAAAAEQGEEKA